ncbi:MAG: secondary thiamine-phosphate synthase enzyme YjbQ, partial [Chloroflexi bacterium]|nr:secondary thiamine-phosphate synthase enzyme YjbQ [Chloroflexota bacterium]
MRVTEASLRTCTFTLEVYSTTEPEFIDITDRVVECVKQSEIRNGFIIVFSRHTTSAVTIQENEPLLLQDLANTLERFSPRNAHYRHNDFSVRTVHMHEDECPNGHSHCQHLTLGTSESIPLIDGSLPLGKWQRIFMVELDAEGPKPR